METSVAEDSEIDALIESGAWCAWCNTRIDPDQLAVSASGGIGPVTKERMHMHCANKESDGFELEREKGW